MEAQRKFSLIFEKSTPLLCTKTVRLAMETCYGKRLCYNTGVSRFFRPNISRNGRIVRGVIGSLCLIAGIITVDYTLWFGLVLVVAGLFAIFEATRGWCIARACGIKTRI